LEAFAAALGIFVEVNMAESATVFLSYNHNDKESVTAVDQWLRNRRVTVFLDDRTFLPGRELERQIVTQIQKCDKVVCFYSVNSRDRPWVQFEQKIAKIRERNDEQSILLYFRLDESELPIADSDRLAINAYDLSFDEACLRLLSAILEKPFRTPRIDLNQYQEFPPWFKPNKTVGELTEFIKKSADERPHRILSDLREDIRSLMTLPDEVLINAIADLIVDCMNGLEEEIETTRKEIEIAIEKRVNAKSIDEMGNATFMILSCKLDELVAEKTGKVLQRALRITKYIRTRDGIETSLMPILVFTDEL
jgi:hypothetical protein